MIARSNSERSRRCRNPHVPTGSDSNPSVTWGCAAVKAPRTRGSGAAFVGLVASVSDLSGTIWVIPAPENTTVTRHALVQPGIPLTGLALVED
jgi:hypothetical protein